MPSNPPTPLERWLTCVARRLNDAGIENPRLGIKWKTWDSQKLMQHYGNDAQKAFEAGWDVDRYAGGITWACRQEQNVTTDKIPMEVARLAFLMVLCDRSTAPVNRDYLKEKLLMLGRSETPGELRNHLDASSQTAYDDYLHRCRYRILAAPWRELPVMIVEAWN